MVTRVFSTSIKPTSFLSSWWNGVNKDEKSYYSTHNVVSFLTDVEGDADYLKRFVNQSRILEFAPYNREYQFPFDFPYSEWIDFSPNHKNTYFVFGGDVWDQGGSDLYVIRQLLALQARYPHRVHFILGNRDINKLRIGLELGNPGDRLAPESDPNSIYVRSAVLSQVNANLISSRNPVDRLKSILKDTMGSPRAFEYRKRELQELQQTKNESDLAITDYDVVESYRKSCHAAGGEMALYLSQGKLAFRLGPALFLHGALPLTDTLLRHQQQQQHLHGTNFWMDFTKLMPWLDPGETAQSLGVTNTMEWIEALNHFCRNCIQEWLQLAQQKNIQNIDPNNNANQNVVPAWTKLIQYGRGKTPENISNPTVVYSSWSETGIPPSRFQVKSTENQLYVDLVKAFFQQSPGLRIICSGHQPQGDMPNVIGLPLERHGSTNVSLAEGQPKAVVVDPNSTAPLVWILSADTSYSGDVLFYGKGGKPPLGREGSKSGRGMRAVSEVLISWIEDDAKHESLDNVNSEASSSPLVYCHGILSDGTAYETLPLPMTVRENGFNVGNVPVVSSPKEGLLPGTDNGWWTRAAFRDGSVLLCSGMNYIFWNCLVKTTSTAPKP